MSIFGNNVAERSLLENRGFEKTGSTSDVRAGSAPCADKDGFFEENLFRMETKELLISLDRVADRLFRFPSPRVLADYRSLVGQVLQKAEAMIDIRRDFSLGNNASRMIIDRTRKGLKDLEEVIGREGRRSRIMGLTAEIRGCLLSLVA